MEAETTTLFNRIKLLSAEGALERLFETTDDAVLKAELEKWFFFGLTGNGKSLSTLNSVQLAELMDKIPDLVLALYTFHQEIQKGADK
ncbi:hypothetical protein [Mucilaginibacter ginkgonis]|uniref:Uncharacterized protein n=1 Tax=Mucilaginibacter ginkgonis TaxID=2682091 RepID=A0A6I4HWX7_9SPHI|nr:hypothetical protein [Mucilaginibacter ginkgonis]QQL49894.1 hypothetical protein GO620_000135 [Mucilaginibacter ginkgonis]